MNFTWSCDIKRFSAQSDSLLPHVPVSSTIDVLRQLISFERLMNLTALKGVVPYRIVLYDGCEIEIIELVGNGEV
jgi:hypothetical protein